MSKRLNQYLVYVGLAESRRKADSLIQLGKVSINGTITTELATRVQEADTVTVDGQKGIQKSDIYIGYNKPRGEICSHRRQGGTRVIFDHLPKSFGSLKIAGRLDRDSRGLVVCSSDGVFINELTHPSKNKIKIYIVKTQGRVTDIQLNSLNKGVRLDDGISTMTVRRIKPNLLRIEMQEGKNRQIRRTLQALGLDVIDLERIAIGKLKLTWPEGQYQFIKPNDVL